MGIWATRRGEGREEVESGELGVGWCCGEGERGAKLRCMMSDGLGREDERAVEVLRGLGGAPATPFFEGRVARLVLGYLREMGVEHWRDEYGNIVARYRRGDVAGRPAVAFVAHMDHPGFEVVGGGRAAGGGDRAGRGAGGFTYEGHGSLGGDA